MTKRSRVWKRVFSVRITWALEEPANFLCRFSITTLSSNPNIFPLVESSPHLSVNIGFTWTQVYLSHLKQCCVQLSSDATTHRRCLWHILARYANWGEASLTNICSQIQQTHTHTHFWQTRQFLALPWEPLFWCTGCRWSQTRRASSSTNICSKQAELANRIILGTAHPLWEPVWCTSCKWHALNHYVSPMQVGHIHEI